MARRPVPQRRRSERSRIQILDAALRLFSKRGYRGTSVRDIAEAAGASTGNVYHQFPDKETIFQALLERYWRAIDDPEFPFKKALAEGAFPDDLEELGRASRESVARYRPYVALIYVDVVEFDGRHIRKFYSDMARNFQEFMEHQGGALEKKLRPGVSPLSAIMLASRFLLHYFAVELVFGVPNHFGKDTDSVLKDIAEILKHGMLPEDAATAPKPARVKGGPSPPAAN